MSHSAVFCGFLAAIGVYSGQEGKAFSKCFEDFTGLSRCCPQIELDGEQVGESPLLGRRALGNNQCRLSLG